ncbi:GSCOCG00011537001-RA-CDS, partial [Cotesia congregata]
VLKKVIDGLNDLKRNGIEVTIDNKQQKIYFDCGLILGDNLGLNGILRFVESFSSGYPRRICR